MCVLCPRTTTRMELLSTVCVCVLVRVWTVCVRGFGSLCIPPRRRAQIFAVLAVAPISFAFTYTHKHTRTHLSTARLCERTGKRSARVQVLALTRHTLTCQKRCTHIQTRRARIDSEDLSRALRLARPHSYLAYCTHTHIRRHTHTNTYIYTHSAHSRAESVRADSLARRARGALFC